MNMKKITYNVMDYNELEKVVNQTYGVSEYEFVAVQECDNNSDHIFVVTKPEPLNEWGVKDLDEFVKKNGLKPYVNYLVMQDLVNRGVLEPGNYLINVSW